MKVARTQKTKAELSNIFAINFAFLIFLTLNCLYRLCVSPKVIKARLFSHPNSDLKCVPQSATPDIADLHESRRDCFRLSFDIDPTQSQKRSNVRLYPNRQIERNSLKDYMKIGKYYSKSYTNY